jgi:hypothetical protein
MRNTSKVLQVSYFYEKFKMKRIFYVIIGIVIGILLSLLYFEKQKNKTIHQQSNVILENIEKMNKLVVTEAYYNEVFSYSDSDKYFFDMVNFDKNAVLLVNARAQISYDLSQLKIEVDSIHKIIKIKEIPQEEITIIPDIKYYDLQQSSFNSFTKEELNTMNSKAIEQIKSHIDLSDIRKKAKERLLEELNNIFVLSKVYDWKVEEGDLQIIKHDLKL